MTPAAWAMHLAWMTVPWVAMGGRARADDIVPAESRPAAAIDPALAAQLESIDRRAAAIRDVTASFEERKFTALLKKPLVSSGTLRSVGSRARWDTKSPHPSAMVVDAAGIRIYYPERSTLEVYALDEKLRWLAVSPLPRLMALLDRFYIERTTDAERRDSETPHAHLALRLHPRDEAVGRYVRQVDVLLDTDTAFVVRVEMLDVDGDRTVISFSDIRANAGIGDADVELTVPGDTRIVRPLAGIETPPPAPSP